MAESRVERLTAAISRADLHRRHGRVSDLIGLIVEATGLEAEVGEVCEIATGRSRSAVPAEGDGCARPTGRRRIPSSARGSASA
jgi:flagellar biosynthesis/type III secretory pathway ATPase